ncbi:hypothetical protein BDV40DRAFT_258192 [Aspergillus tamarii]|uniref:Uncharacterized protein n=1 Tax=Aspergillus tamarii TaxID=41984 RepID=A0A5N6V6D3_ASPTM|nr:hypothetical protein BDV40DRAFT_258192 [Aspergillus tamarii]
MLLKYPIYYIALLVLAIAAVAKPQCDPNKIKSLELREVSTTDETNNIEERDINEDWDTITTYTLDDDEDSNVQDKADADAINPLAPSHCSNCAKIKKAKPKYKGKCDPKNSLGWKSSHNCKGTSYLCVQSGKATCYGRPLSKLNFENGECFK